MRSTVRSDRIHAVHRSAQKPRSRGAEERRALRTLFSSKHAARARRSNDTQGWSAYARREEQDA
jgi:hypothetical protein